MDIALIVLVFALLWAVIEDAPADIWGEAEEMIITIIKILAAWLCAGFCLALWIGPRLHQGGEEGRGA